MLFQMLLTFVLIASFYELRFTNSKNVSNSEIDFDDGTPIHEEDLIYGSLNQPLLPGNVVTLQFKKTKIHLSNTSYFFRARAVDEANNVSHKFE